MPEQTADSGVLPRCFLDVAVDGETVGRIVVELFTNVCPKTCENFRALCTGEKSSSQRLLHFRGSPFHRVIKNFMIQGGDFINGNGTGGESIYGHVFADENFTLKHDRDFLLSMANKGPNTNGSQFFILTKPAPHLDGIHVVFGRVVNADGKRIVKMIESEKVDEKYQPLRNVQVVNCGELMLLKKSKPEKRKKHESEASASESSKSESESENEEKEEKEVKEEKEKKKSKKDKKKKSKKEKKRSKSSAEKETTKTEEDDFVCSVRPDEIPPVPSNKFLSRCSDRSLPTAVAALSTSGPPPLPPNRREVPFNARVIKGRGTFRYNPDQSPSPDRDRGGHHDYRSGRRDDSSYGRMRSEDRGKRRNGDSDEELPAHWREAQQRTIPLNVYERRMKGRKERENYQVERDRQMADQLRREEQARLARQLADMEREAERQERREKRKEKRRESRSRSRSKSASSDRERENRKKAERNASSSSPPPRSRPQKPPGQEASKPTLSRNGRNADEEKRPDNNSGKRTVPYSDDSSSGSNSSSKLRNDRGRGRDRSRDSPPRRPRSSSKSSRSASSSSGNHGNYPQRNEKEISSSSRRAADSHPARPSRFRSRTASKSRSRSRSSDGHRRKDSRPARSRSKSRSSSSSSSSRSNSSASSRHSGSKSRSRSRSWRRETKKR